LEAGEERCRCCQFEPPSSSQVNILSSRSRGHGAVLVEPAHIGQCADNYETGSEESSIVQFDEDARHSFVGNLVVEFSEVPDLLGTPRAVKTACQPSYPRLARAATSL
jgi:hypothetical protein